MIRAVLLDLDGTLLDHAAARDGALLGQLGMEDAPPAERERWCALWLELEDQHFDDHLAGNITFPEQRRRRCRDLHVALGADDPGEGWVDWWSRYAERYRAGWRVYEDVIPALDALGADGLAFAIVTNGSPEVQHEKLAAVGLADRMDAVLTAGEVGAPKPGAAIFAAACDALGVSAAEAIHIGDLLDADALGAAAAGLHGVWLDRSGAEPTTVPSEITRITSLAALPDLMQRNVPGTLRGASGR